MAKLYFRYGTVGSAKTLNLLAVAHNYMQQDKRAFIIKPELDVRFGRQVVHSRAGVEKEADLLVGPETKLEPGAFQGIDCVLVDEAQFLVASGVASGGMIPKINACRRALSGNTETRIIDGRRPHALLREFEAPDGGTTIYK